MNHSKWRQAAFSLIEILITIAIISILIAIAAPSYARYTRRAHYTAIVHSAAPLKTAVENCFQINGDITNCSGAQQGIPPDITQPSGQINSTRVQAGKITITPSNKHGITSADTYILTPTLQHDNLTWQSSGGGVEHGYAH